MPRPVFDNLWRHESYQPPLPSDKISDLISFRETRKRGKEIDIEKYVNSFKPPDAFCYLYLVCV